MQYDEAVSLTFDASDYSGIYDMTWTLQFESMASACAAETCAEVEACLAEDGDAACAGAGDCSCTVTYAFEEQPLEGSYSVENDALDVSGWWFEPPGPHPYCRNGDVLTIWSPQYIIELTETPCETHEDCAHIIGDGPDYDPAGCFEL